MSDVSHNEYGCHQNNKRYYVCTHGMLIEWYIHAIPIGYITGYGKAIP